jgi:hypothetical protein
VLDGLFGLFTVFQPIFFKTLVAKLSLSLLEKAKGVEYAPAPAVVLISESSALI